MLYDNQDAEQFGVVFGVGLTAAFHPGENPKELRLAAYEACQKVSGHEARPLELPARTPNP